MHASPLLHDALFMMLSLISAVAVSCPAQGIALRYHAERKTTCKVVAPSLTLSSNNHLWIEFFETL